MTMEDYNKVFENLRIDFARVRHLKLTKHFTIFGFEENCNNIILVNKGSLRVGEKDGLVAAGQVVFIPSKRKTSIRYGGEEGVVLTTDQFLSNRDNNFSLLTDKLPSEIDEDSISIISFDCKIFDNVDFFHTLELPSFIIRDNPVIIGLMEEAVSESLGARPGGMRIVKANADQLTIEILRHVMDRKIFLEQIATNIVYFKDPRLVKIFYHIRRNLSGDLSNKILAELADVSEDYVGQYFKALTGINPQDYIEYQRMEEAIHLLRTTKYSIAEIGEKVGFNGTAYFCRRFKMMFGIPAAKMRRRETIVAV